MLLNLKILPASRPYRLPVKNGETNFLVDLTFMSKQDTAQKRAEGQLLTGRAAKMAAQTSLSPVQLAWRELRKNRAAMIGLWTLVALYTIALFAPFIAPYDPQDQLPGARASQTFHPPMRVRFRDREGAFHLRPFVYGSVQQFTPIARYYLSA